MGIRLSSANLRLSSANRRRVIRNRQQTQSLLQNLQRKWWRRILASSTLRLRSRRIIRGLREETIFINEAKGCGMMMDYLWNIDGPIYSLADVESQREAIAANLMQNLF